MANKLFKFTYELNHFKFDKQGFTKQFDKAAQVLIRQAARAWLKEVIVKVAVYTGFALGSIKFAQGAEGTLSQYLNYSIPITPKYQRPRWYYHIDGRRVPKIPDRAGAFSRYSFPSSQKRYRFFFRSDVIHLIINDRYSSFSPSSPWHALRAGRMAFRSYIKQNAKKLPNVNSYMTKEWLVRQLY